MSLLRGEAILTVNILLGTAFGVLILHYRIAERLMGLLTPFLKRIGIGPQLAFALTLSLGSSRAGAAVLASSLEEGRISERTAKWGTLMLSFPAYLHRWPSTMIMSASMAGIAGAFFALALLLRSALRFLTLALIVRDKENEAFEADVPAAAGKSPSVAAMVKKITKMLPLAWFFYAVAYAAVPYAERFLQAHMAGGSFLPLAGWTVAAAAISHVSASLALAGGALASGELSVAQGVFALLLGNSLGVVTRAFRQNAGYYFGFFPGKLAQQMIALNVATQIPFAAAALLIAALPLL